MNKNRNRINLTFCCVKGFYLISVFCFLILYRNAAAYFETEINRGSDVISYNDFISETGAAIDQLEQQDTGFFRLEKDFQRDINDSMQFSYNGISHYSSTVKPVIMSFLSKLGFNQTYYWTRYGRGSTVFADSLLGIKYLLSKNGSIPKPYTKNFTENGITVFENPFALPVGFAAGQSLVLGTDIYSDNLFEIQNSIFQSLSGDKGRVLLYAAEPPLISYQNITVESGEDVFPYMKKLIRLQMVLSSGKL
ncbi:MAG: YfhO family protein [Flexilinea sp.]